jgi:6-phosphogluconate dehydrogenase
MVGLGVLGPNLVLNMADHDCAAAGYDQDQATVEALRQESKERGAVHVGSFGGLIFPDFALRLKPVLTCLAIAAASLLVEFIGPFGDLRCHIDRFLGQ